MGSLWGSMDLKTSPLFCLIPSGCNSTAFRERGKERALKRKSSVMRMGRGGEGVAMTTTDIAGCQPCFAGASRGAQ